MDPSKCATSGGAVRMVSAGPQQQHRSSSSETTPVVSVDNHSSNNNSPGVASIQKAMSDSGEDGVIAAPAATSLLLLNTQQSTVEVGDDEPAEIPPESGDRPQEGGENDNDHDENDDDDEEEESEYEYEDDEDAAFSGFLVDNPQVAAAGAATFPAKAEGQAAAPARIRDEGDDDDEEDALVSNHKSNNNNKAKWREPSREAVSMSLRAEREKTGSKRRLAQDLYRIMNQDTEEAGFSIAPKSEDNMDHWIIKLFMFDADSNLAKDMLVLGFEHIELEMTFPDQYPFEPPFVRVVRPRFKRQTGFVMNGALCMELLTKDGWNPVNDIESVIVSIRSLLVVGDGRLQAAYEMPEPKYQARLKASSKKADEDPSRKRQKKDEDTQKRSSSSSSNDTTTDGGSYSVAEAHAAYSHLSDYHKKKGWDSSGWWARKG